MPIVEPEVLMDGDHTIERCDQATRDTLAAVFAALHRHRVRLDGMLLKPNMVVSGGDSVTQAGVDQVAEWTVAALLDHVPASVPGIVFLSGGQSDEAATAHLNAMNRLGGAPGSSASPTAGRCRQPSRPGRATRPTRRRPSGPSTTGPG